VFVQSTSTLFATPADSSSPAAAAPAACRQQLLTCGHVLHTHLLACCAHHRFVRRKYNPLTGDVAVAGVVDEAHAVQTAVGDLLFLKGNAFPGLFGEQQQQLLQACRWAAQCLACWLLPRRRMSVVVFAMLTFQSTSCTQWKCSFHHKHV
jgi:hypothetical protein